jgi:hypothetical protein
MKYEYWLEIGNSSEYFDSEDDGKLALFTCGHSQAKLKRGRILNDEDGEYFADVSEYDVTSDKWVGE